MDHPYLFAQSDLAEYARLVQQEEELAEKSKALREKFIAAAKEAQAKNVALKDATEPGALRVVVSLGTKRNTSWSGVVDAIREKNCLYQSNGGGKLTPLNSVLSSMIEGRTKEAPNNRIEVKPNVA